MNIFLIFSILFSLEYTSNIEYDFNRIKDELINIQLAKLDQEIKNKKAYLETIYIYEDTYNIMLHQYYHILAAYNEFNKIINLAENELNIFLQKSQAYDCKFFNKRFAKKLKKINKYNKKNNFNELLGSNIINRHIVNYFEYTYLFLIYLKEKTDFYTNDSNICELLDNYSKAFTKLEIDKKIIENSDIIFKFSSTHSTFISWYYIDSNNDLIDNRNKQYSLSAFFSEDKNIFDSYLKVNNFLKEIEYNLFSFISKETLIKLKIYNINILKNIYFFEQNSIFRQVNTYALIDKNNLFLAYNFNIYYYLFCDLISELVYNFSNEDTNLIWQNVGNNYKNFDIIYIANYDFENLSIEEQKALVVKGFLRNPRSINDRLYEYIKILFSAEYALEEKTFKSIDQEYNYKNLKSLLENSSFIWPETLNRFIIINTK